MKKRRGFTWEQHVVLGRSLATFRNEVLIRAACDIPNAYGLNCKGGRLAQRAINALDALRCEMDNLVCGEHPETGADPNPTLAYYPGKSK